MVVGTCLLATLAVAGRGESIRVCAEVVAERPDTADLVRALRARLEADGVEVSACGRGRAEIAHWRIVLRATPGDRTFELTVAGDELNVERQLGFHPDAGDVEIAQRAALEAAQIVAPGTDSLLERLARKPPGDAGPDPLPDTQPELPTDPAAEANNIVPRAPPRFVERWWIGALVGPQLGLEQRRPALYTAASVGALIGAGVALSAHLAWVESPGRTGAGYRVRSSAWEAGIGAALMGGAGVVGLRLQTRSTAYRPSGEALLGDTGTRRVWDLGAGATLLGWVSRLGPVRVGLFARAALWLFPRQLLIQGQRVLTEDFGTAAIGVHVAWWR